MDILAQLRCSASAPASYSPWSTRRRQNSHRPPPPFNPRCSRRDSRRNDNGNDKKGDGGSSSTDWDKAWSSFRKQGGKKKKKKNLFSDFSPNKYVSWNPRRSEYPLSEEVDPIKRTERSNLILWTSPQFTLTVAILIVTFLLLYTILAPSK